MSDSHKRAATILSGASVLMVSELTAALEGIAFRQWQSGCRSGEEATTTHFLCGIAGVRLELDRNGMIRRIF